MIAASRLDPHSRLTVVAGTEVGSPASSTAIRATLRLSSPAPLALPSTTSSIWPWSSAGCPVDQPAHDVRGQVVRAYAGSAPPYRPNGVRTAS